MGFIARPKADGLIGVRGAPVIVAVDIGNVPDDWLFSFQLSRTFPVRRKLNPGSLRMRFVLSPDNGHFLLFMEKQIINYF